MSNRAIRTREKERVRTSSFITTFRNHQEFVDEISPNELSHSFARWHIYTSEHTHHCGRTHWLRVFRHLGFSFGNQQWNGSLSHSFLGTFPGLRGSRRAPNDRTRRNASIEGSWGALLLGKWHWLWHLHLACQQRALLNRVNAKTRLGWCWSGLSRVHRLSSITTTMVNSSLTHQYQRNWTTQRICCCNTRWEKCKHVQLIDYFSCVHPLNVYV